MKFERGAHTVSFLRALASAEIDVIIDKQGQYQCSTPALRKIGQHNTTISKLHQAKLLELKLSSEE